jgi:hypothetical protein
VRGEAGRLDAETGTMRGAVEGFLRELRAA